MWVCVRVPTKNREATQDPGGTSIFWKVLVPECVTVGSSQLRFRSGFRVCIDNNGVVSLQLVLLRRYSSRSCDAAALQLAVLRCYKLRLWRCSSQQRCNAQRCGAASLQLVLLRRCTGCCDTAVAPGAVSDDATALQQLAVLRRCNSSWCCDARLWIEVLQ